jgi:hypothetical protein
MMGKISLKKFLVTNKTLVRARGILKDRLIFISVALVEHVFIDLEQITVSAQSTLAVQN